MSDKQISQSKVSGNALLPFDIKKWQESANLFLSHTKWGSSPLESASIALQTHDPELSEKCLIEAKRRKRNSYGKI